MKLPRRPPPLDELLTRFTTSEITAILKSDASRETLRACEHKYWHYDKLRVAAPRGVDVNLLWLLAKLTRQQRYQETGLYGAEEEPLKFNLPGRLQQDLMRIDQGLAGHLLTPDAVRLDERQKQRYILSTLREEAIASSMLEGAATTRRVAKRMLETGRKPRSRGERMVLNNYHAMQFVREHKATPLSEPLLLELHTILTQDTLDDPDEVGRFRTADDEVVVIDVRDNEVTHVPPPAEELDDRLTSFIGFANRPGGDDPFIHPVIRACILHFQIGFLHPFCDGNGRTARALFYWLLFREGYWLFEYLPISRLIEHSPAKYQRAFLYCENDEFDLTYFLNYKARVIRMARQELSDHLAAQRRKATQAQSLLRSDSRLNHRQREATLDASRDPNLVFTIASHMSRHAVSYGTAREDLLKLVEWGYLVKQRVGNRFDFTPAAHPPSHTEPEDTR